MRITFTNTETISISTDDVSVTWRAAMTRQFGECTITLRRDSAAFSSRYISDDGGSVVQIHDPVGGTWTGFANVVTQTDENAVVQGQHLAALTAHSTVGYGADIQMSTAGALAHECVRRSCGESLSGILFPGTFVEAAPYIDNFGFNGQDLSTALSTLSDTSGQEWEITEDGIINWVPVVGRTIEYYFVDGTIIRNLNRQTDSELQVTEIIARGQTGQEFLARLSPDNTLLRRQEVIQVQTTNQITLGQTALRALQQRSALPNIWRGELSYPDSVPVVTDSGGITQGWGDQPWGSSWGGAIVLGAVTDTALSVIREGDVITVILPYQGFAGDIIVARVMSRTIIGGYDWIALELTEIPNIIIGGTVVPTFILNQSGTTPRQLDSVALRLRNSFQRLSRL
jgi:hypothetical protein